MLNKIEEITERIQNTNWLKHLLFWSLVVLSFISRDRILDLRSFYTSFVRQLCLLIPQMAASYFLGYYWVSKYILTKRKIIYKLLLITTIYLTCVLGRVLIVYVSEGLTRTPPFRQESLIEIMLNWRKLMLEYFPSIYIVVLGFLFLKFFVHFTNAKQNELKISKEKVESELNVLKAQLNPHFLFNTLNNIYVLAIENSPKTAYSIERLSEILDYVLYRCTDKYTSLYNEIRMLESYIELEKLRYDDRLQVIFNKDVCSDIKIAPLILLSFVENAFKHGAGEDSGSPKIDISINYDGSFFKFMISNTIQQARSDLDRKKIGLINVKKQLDLLYPNLYVLEIDSNREDLFLVNLRIEILDEN
ncbi:sensor histidine kinase [Aquimarina sp. 2201CG5-10]|uniref:sensor histidine kinase n=1 Tax=Aquimarina callyspongiae TaxID=3098150 RepID=UPI002AB48C79|nr:histidine kinase [Aquimarina sp. 2201CG5-10]MDY8135063.1 histidine kinase [Aquimarina sp. 2201CG5-10]